MLMLMHRLIRLILILSLGRRIKGSRIVIVANIWLVLLRLSIIALAVSIEAVIIGDTQTLGII